MNRGADVVASENLVPYDAARALAHALARPLPIDEVALDDAAGRILARTLYAAEDLVPFARSAMDGYAVRARDLVVGVPLPVAARIVAGDPPCLHAPRTATAIATGAALPDGADTVVRWEDVERCGETIVVRVAVTPGAHLFPAGDDARRGDRLAAAGTPIDAGRLGLLGAAGYARVPVRRPPRAALVVTGDELVPPHAPLVPGTIRNSNGPMLAAALRAAGAVVASTRTVGDDLTALLAALTAACDRHDLVITTGGASAGPRDLVKTALDALGARFAFRSVAMRPAKPAAVATLGASVVLVLPGNPSAAFAAYHAFGGAILAGLAAAAPPATVAVRLRGTIVAKPERTYLAFARLVVDEDARLTAAVLPNQCSSLTASAAHAGALVTIPPGSRVYGDGDLVDALVLHRALSG